MRLNIFNAREPKDLNDLPAALMKSRSEAMTLVSSQLFAGHREQLLSIAIATKTPMIYWAGTFVEAGGLMSYGVNISGALPPCGHLRRQDSQRRQACRHPGGATDKI